MTTEEQVSRGLWIDPNFLKLWGSETISLFGSAITSLALPLLAVQLLNATPAQMGYLGAAQFLPFLLLSLPLGVWVDRRRRRPLLVLANLGRALLLALIPLGAMLGWLRMEVIYPIAFFVGTCDALFHLAYSSYLPGLVGQHHLVEGNSKLQASASVAEIAGPGLAGVLVGWLGAPVAIAVDVTSYLLSALGIGTIRHVEISLGHSRQKVNLIREIKEGLQLIFRHPMLRIMAVEAATFNGGAQALSTLLVLYATRELHLSADRIGLIYGVAGVGALIGSMVAGPLARRIGFGRALVSTAALACIPPLLVPAAQSAPGFTLPVLMTAFFLEGMGLAASSIHFLSLRQALSPVTLLGRMTASYRTLTYGIVPLGALFFGFLGERVGVRTALWIGTGLMSVAWLWVRFSPVWRLEELPQSPAIHA
ncbi:MFS transporter [Deinococcus aquatilis]|uniref:MFS transporter n=1 Tax=Deinococcus aquatilis TaxID=519440 RepID=UPI00036AC939|nr:MFS transporter [Deinococcus aquatilis]